MAWDVAPANRLDKALAAAAPEGAALSRSRLQKLIQSGAVRPEGGDPVTDAKATVGDAEVWWVTLPPAEAVETMPQRIPLDVVYEDDELIVVDKPAGMVVHPAPGAEDGTLVNALLHHCGDSLSGIGGEKRPGIVHRIDKDTSGLLVVAKNDLAHQGLAEQFARHDLERHYIALVWGCPSTAHPRLQGIPGVSFEPGNVIRIQGNIDRHRSDRKKMAVTTRGGRHAVTRARVLQAFGPAEKPVCALVECWLETGRTHQIRVHLAHIGHALIGDPVYGRSRAIAKGALHQQAVEALRAFPRQALHAATLGFLHPTSGKSLSFSSELPTDMAEIVSILGGNPTG